MTEKEIPRHKLNPLVRERDNYKCKFCSRNVLEACEECSGGNTLHHIIPKRYGGKEVPSNKFTICYHCHQLLEICITQVEKALLKRCKQQSKKQLDEFAERCKDAHKMFSDTAVVCPICNKAERLWVKDKNICYKCEIDKIKQEMKA